MQDFENSSSPKFSQEDLNFFDEIVNRFHIDQDIEHFIIHQDDGRDVYIQKGYYVPIDGQQGSQKMKVEEYIQHILNGEDPTNLEDT